MFEDENHIIARKIILNDWSSFYFYCNSAVRKQIVMFL